MMKQVVHLRMNKSRRQISNKIFKMKLLMHHQTKTLQLSQIPKKNKKYCKILKNRLKTNRLSFNRKTKLLKKTLNRLLKPNLPKKHQSLIQQDHNLSQMKSYQKRIKQQVRKQQKQKSSRQRKFNRLKLLKQNEK